MDRFQKIEQIFKRLDKDRSGDIDKSEIKRFFKKAAGEGHNERNRTADSLMKYFDQDGDGCIDLQEFKDGFKNLERGEGADFVAEKMQFFLEHERLDPADGQLKTFAMFLKAYGSKPKAQAQWDEAGRIQEEKEQREEMLRAKAAAVFAKLDLDGNGWIDAMELKRFFRKIAGESQLERRRTAAEILRFFDRNGDGLIDQLEFELGCILAAQSEGDEFIQKKLELLFAIDDTTAISDITSPVAASGPASPDGKASPGGLPSPTQAEKKEAQVSFLLFFVFFSWLPNESQNIKHWQPLAMPMPMPMPMPTHNLQSALVLTTNQCDCCSLFLGVYFVF